MTTREEKYHFTHFSFLELQKHLASGSRFFSERFSFLRFFLFNGLRCAGTSLHEGKGYIYPNCTTPPQQCSCELSFRLSSRRSHASFFSPFSFLFTSQRSVHAKVRPCTPSFSFFPLLFVREVFPCFLFLFSLLCLHLRTTLTLQRHRERRSTRSTPLRKVDASLTLCTRALANGVGEVDCWSNAQASRWLADTSAPAGVPARQLHGRPP